jgi:hypothetical protein
MRTKKQLHLWLQSEIEDVMDSYDNTREEAIEHIYNMLTEGQDSYSDVNEEEIKIILGIIKND